MIGTVKIAFASLLVAASIQTQKPNFAGTWVPTGKPGVEMIITQNDKQIGIDYWSSGKSVRKDDIILDGAEHRRTIPTRNGDVAMIYKAAWLEAKLVITTETTYPGGVKTALTEVWSMDAKGQLVIDGKEIGPGGKGATSQMILARKK